MTTRDQRRETRWLGLAIGIICMAGGEIVRAACTTEYEYNDAGDATRTFIHDGQGATVSDTFTVYDALGRQSTVFNRATVGSNGGAMTTVYTYDVAGRLATKAVKTDGPADFATSYVYDALGRQVTVQGPATGAANAPMTIYDYDLNGNVITQSVRLYGDTYADTVTDYDAMNRATKMTYPGATAPERHYRGTAYDSQGRVIATYAYDAGRSVTLERTRTVYDGAGRVLTRARMADASNDGDFSVATDNVVAYAYDADGHVTRQTTYNMGTTTALDTTSEYDGLGRLTKTTDPNGFWEQTAYDATGLATMRVSYDYAGQTFSMGYDPDGRMTQQIALGSTNLTTGYQYDCLDRRTRAIDPKGYVTVYEYDLLAHQTKVTEDDGGALPRATWSMYNQQGWLTDLIAY
jgi:YD repeat-containing protein